MGRSILKAVLICFPVFSLLTSCSETASTDASKQNEKLTSYVDPFMGTADHGHVYPGATVPFGAVQLSPDNGTQGWDWCSGYNWADSTIVGFSHTHLSGTGIGDLCDLLLMPAINKVDFSRYPANPKDNEFATTFSHDREEAAPGYYRVTLDNGIMAELTASTRAGLHRYTFPEGVQPTVVIDLGYAINWDSPTETNLLLDNSTTVAGYRYSQGWARDQKLFFAIKFSSPVTDAAIADSTEISDVGGIVGRRARGQFFFELGEDRQLLVKVGISSANSQGAYAALKEIPDWNFEQTRGQADSAWNAELEKLRIETPDVELKKTFYTSLYRTCLAPVVYSDPYGNYKGADGKVQHAEGYTRYDIFSLWDTFRAANPLYTLTQPDRINDFIRSLLAHYEEYGLLPVWSLLGNETNTMTGYHAVPVIADAYLKGFRDYDVEKAFAALEKSAMQDIRGTNFYREYGYIPYDKEGQSVTKTLEYAYDDWCIAQMAEALGKEADQKRFLERAAYFRNLFDPSTGFMRAKYSNGQWKTPFDPKYSDHNFEVAEYTEGNAWQHSWFVPHDVRGLIELQGGNEAFIQKLDSLFNEDSEIRGENASADISGLIGQYAHGNEPSHHIAYLYNYAGAPWRTQSRVRQIMATQYNATPAGLCGNEDCGQMSAWYVFSALGFYPVNPAQGVYVIGSPLFEKSTMTFAGGKTFTVEARNASLDNMYIQSATLNGQPLERSFITHAEVTAGGILVLEMGPQPNENLWNTPDMAPPSMTGN